MLDKINKKKTNNATKCYSATNCTHIYKLSNNTDLFKFIKIASPYKTNVVIILLTAPNTSLLCV